MSINHSFGIARKAVEELSKSEDGQFKLGYVKEYGWHVKSDRPEDAQGDNSFEVSEDGASREVPIVKMEL